MAKIIRNNNAVKSADPVLIEVQLGKTVQERQYEPFNATVSMKAKILPNEVSSEFQRVYEILDEELATILNARFGADLHGSRTKKKGRNLRD